MKARRILLFRIEMHTLFHKNDDNGDYDDEYNNNNYNLDLA